MTEAASEQAADFLSEILISLNHLDYLLKGGQLTMEQYDTLRSEVYNSDI